MTLWFVFALMTVAAIFAVLWPLSRSSAPKAGGNEATVYRDQLAEIDRDAAAGLIGVSEAEAARVEISRRLLAAVDAERDLPARSNLGLRRASAVLALVALPVAAVTFYLSLGTPQLGDFPLASRTRTADANQPLDNMVAQVEAHLEKNPTDGRGWTVLAPVLARLGRYDDAVRAYRNSITYAGDSAERRADLGEVACRRCGRGSDGGGQGRVRARGRAERRRSQGELFPRAGGRTGRPAGGCRLHLARHARQGARRCAVAAACCSRRWRGSAARLRRRFRTMRWRLPRT